MDYVDKNMEQVLSLAQGMTRRGQAMNEQLSEQTAAVGQFNQRVDNANQRVAQLNTKIDKQIDKY